MGTRPEGGSWLRKWFMGNGPGQAEALQALLSQICQQETALACHLAERARALRFAPHRRSLEVLAERERQNAHAVAREIRGETTLTKAAPPPRRPGTLTATKLIRDLGEAEDLAALYRQASRLTSDEILRGKLEGLAVEEARGAQTIRGILATMDSYVTDLP